MKKKKKKIEFKWSCLKQYKVSFILRSVVNIFVVYELDTWSRHLNADFILKDCLFGVVKLTTNPNPNSSCSSGYGIEFDFHSLS